MNRHTLLIAVCLVLPGCALWRGGNVPAPPPSSGKTLPPVTLPTPPRDLDSIPDAVPRAEPRSRYGNPESYVVFGQTYRVQKSARGHVERGLASWYGPGFHAERTSSGEPYDMTKPCPYPSMCGSRISKMVDRSSYASTIEGLSLVTASSICRTPQPTSST